MKTTEKPPAVKRAKEKKPDNTRTLRADPEIHAEIQKQAQARFIASAAIDAAVAMQRAKLPNQNPTKAHLERKERVKLADIRQELLLRVAEGESVFTISHDAHMPARHTLYRWIREDPQFKQEYEAALEQRADKYVEQIADLSAQLSARAQMGASNEEVTALKSHINTLQWIAARLNAKKYGDRQQLDIDQKVTLNEQQVDQRLATLLGKAKPLALPPAKTVEADE